MKQFVAYMLIGSAILGVAGAAFAGDYTISNGFYILAGFGLYIFGIWGAILLLKWGGLNGRVIEKGKGGFMLKWLIIGIIFLIAFYLIFVVIPNNKKKNDIRGCDVFAKQWPGNYVDEFNWCMNYQPVLDDYWGSCKPQNI